MIIPAHFIFSALISGLTFIDICRHRVKEFIDLSKLYVWQILVCKEGYRKDSRLWFVFCYLILFVRVLPWRASWCGLHSAIKTGLELKIFLQ